MMNRRSGTDGGSGVLGGLSLCFVAKLQAFAL